MPSALFASLLLAASPVLPFGAAPIRVAPIAPQPMAALARAARAAELPAELLALLPDDTVGILIVPAPKALQTAVRALEQAFGQPSGDDALQTFVQKFGNLRAPVEGLRDDLPIAIALRLPSGMPAPMPMAILPLSDPAAFAAARVKPGAASKDRINGSYVALDLGGDAAGGKGAAIAREMPSGLIAFRMDLAKLIDNWMPMIEMGLEQARASIEASGDPNAALGLDLVIDFLDALESVELGADLQGDALGLHGALVVEEGSALADFTQGSARPLGALAQSYDPEAAMNMAMSVDMARVMKFADAWVDKLAAAVPEDARAQMHAMLQAWSALGGDFSAAAASMDFGAQGLQGCVAYASADPAGCAKAWGAAMESAAKAPGGMMKVTGPTERTVGGLTLSEWRVQMHALPAPAGGSEAQLAGQRAAQQMVERMYGPDGLRIAMLPQTDRVCCVMGGDDDFLARSLARTQRGGGAAPAAWSEVLTHVQGSPMGMAISTDVAKLLEQMAPIMEASGAPAPPQRLAGPLHVDAWFAGRKERWSGALHLSLAELAKAVPHGH